MNENTILVSILQGNCNWDDISSKINSIELIEQYKDKINIQYIGQAKMKDNVIEYLINKYNLQVINNITKYQNLSNEIINKYLKYFLLNNNFWQFQKLSDDFINKYINELSPEQYRRLLKNKKIKITLETIKKIIDNNIGYHYIIKYKHNLLTEKFIIDNNMFNELNDNILLLQNIKLSENFLEKHIKTKRQYFCISRYQDLSLHYMQKHINELSPSKISEYQNLTVDFCYLNKKRINLKKILINKKISTEIKTLILIKNKK
jgi:hypothetical protein